MTQESYHFLSICCSNADNGANIDGATVEM